MADRPETQQLELNFEESGWLYHLLLRQMTIDGARTLVLGGNPTLQERLWEAEVAVYKRQTLLLEKLQCVNDTLRGEKK